MQKHQSRVNNTFALHMTMKSDSNAYSEICIFLNRKIAQTRTQIRIIGGLHHF